MHPADTEALFTNLALPRSGSAPPGTLPVLQGRTACPLSDWLGKMGPSEVSPDFYQNAAFGPPSGSDSALCLRDLVISSLRGKDMRIECRFPVLTGYCRS